MPGEACWGDGEILEEKVHGDFRKRSSCHHPVVSKGLHHGSLLPKEGHLLSLSLQKVDGGPSREPTHCCRMLHQSAAGGEPPGAECDELLGHACVHHKSRDISPYLSYKQH